MMNDAQDIAENGEGAIALYMKEEDDN